MKDPVSYQDFEKLDFRVGQIVKAEAPEWSEKLLRFEVDLGEELGKRVVFSGIRKWYSPEDFLGKKLLFLVNMAPKKMGDEESQGMMVMADGPEKPVMYSFWEEVPAGTVFR